jgi:hypothetical protein
MTRDRSAGGMPGPLSTTTIETVSVSSSREPGPYFESGPANRTNAKSELPSKQQGTADHQQQCHRLAAYQGAAHELLDLPLVRLVATDHQDRPIGQKPRPIASAP